MPEEHQRDRPGQSEPRTDRTGGASGLRQLRPLGLIVAALGLVALAGALWRARGVLFLLFAGALLAIFLSAITDWISGWTRLRRRWAFLAALLLIAGLAVAAALWIAPRVSEQADEMAQRLPQAWQKVEAQLESRAWTNRLLDRLPGPDELMPQGAQVVARATGALSTVAGALAGVLIVLVVGLYLAAQPDVYRKSFLRLIPAAKRERAGQVLSAVHGTLQSWLLAQLVSMSVVGLLTVLGLWALGIPLALTLGLLAGLMEFIPNFGPLLSAVPPVLLALLAGPRQALWVVLLYLGIQTLESYVITPLVQQKMVSLPPVLVIASQLLAGALFGFAGLALATPLLAVAMVLVRTLYIEDVLGESPPG